MSYSPQLLYFLDRLSGFSTNVFKLMPQGSSDAGPGKIVRFSLPANALLNTRSFKVHFCASTTGTGARLPADISSLIERVEISAGGVQLSQGVNFYNTLVKAKASLQGSVCDTVTGHAEIVRKNVLDGSTDIADSAGANETHSDTANNAPHVIDKWEGFLGTCEPKILDASILPDLVVSLYFTSASVLTSSKAADSIANFILAPTAGVSADYTIKNLHATIETIGLADSVYDNMVQSLIAQKGYLEIPFKQYIAFNNTHSGSSRFTIATQSLDRVWTAWRHTGYDTLAPPVIATGHVETANADSPYNGMLSTMREKYHGKYHRFAQPAASAGTKVTYQLQLNGAYFPQFAATAEEMYQITKSSLPKGVKPEMSLEQYTGDYFVQCVRLNMPDSEMSRMISGLDTRSVSLNGYVNTQNTANSTDNLIIFAECTSALRVGAGRQVEVIV